MAPTTASSSTTQTVQATENKKKHKSKICKTLKNCVKQIFEEKKTIAATSDVRGYLLEKYKWNVSKTDWKLVKQELSDLMKGGKNHSDT
jgi:hypothetical protein